MLRRFIALGLLGICVSGCPCCLVRGDEVKQKLASLGAEFRLPTAEEAKAYDLGKAKVGRKNGLYVEAVEKGGPADKAGLKAGDILLGLGANLFYSKDDLADFLRIAKPGTKVDVHVKRAGTFKVEKLSLTLAKGGDAPEKAIVWQYAGIYQLDAALATAKKESKRVLVGLAGADT